MSALPGVYVFDPEERGLSLLFLGLPELNKTRGRERNAPTIVSLSSTEDIGG